MRQRYRAYVRVRLSSKRDAVATKQLALCKQLSVNFKTHHNFVFAGITHKGGKNKHSQP